MDITCFVSFGSEQVNNNVLINIGVSAVICQAKLMAGGVVGAASAGYLYVAINDTAAGGERKGSCSFKAGGAVQEGGTIFAWIKTKCKEASLRSIPFTHKHANRVVKHASTHLSVCALAES